MEPQEALREFGLTDLESKVYLSLLKSGETTATALISQLKLYKATVYDILSALERKGLVAHVQKKNHRVYYSLNPDKLTELLKEKMDALQQVHPILKGYYSTNKPQREISVLVGKDGFRSMMNDMATEEKEILSFGSSLQVFSVMRHRSIQQIKSFNKKSLHPKTLLVDKPEVRKGAEEVKRMIPNIEIKYYPPEFNSPVAFNIYGDKLALNIWEDEIVVIMIEDAAIANAFRGYFRMLWSLAKD
ncbi:MAG: BlaI/MecI/CopY family transcriptional regulator [Candidatus Aenigmarchaeota archaeon]|nr:BlaI/MecI/CopY family transcriptional regulator [Candidatus Aenigmarchaeota archaeon]